MQTASKEEDLRRRLRDIREQLRRPHSRQQPELLRLAEVLDGLADQLDTARTASQTARERHEAAFASLDDRLARIENSVIFRFLRSLGALFCHAHRRLGQWLLHSPLHPMVEKLRKPSGPDPYSIWVNHLEAVHASSAVKETLWRKGPDISIVMPVRQPNPEWLQAAVDSVVGQTYPHWQLCVVNDASPEAWVAQYLDRLTQAEPRVRVKHLAHQCGISGALNAAADLATGQYISLLDHDDVLAPEALERVADALQLNAADVVYTDEDLLDEAGKRCRPNFKPDWSPDLLTSCMYWGHFLTVSRSALDRVGWFRSEFDGAQDYDLALRLSDGPAEVRHVPEVLYHWRRHAGSTASSGDAKPYAHDAGRRALEAAVARRGLQAVVSSGPTLHSYTLERHLEQTPLVSIVVCSRNVQLLRRCLAGIRELTRYPNFEIVVLLHQPNGPADMAMENFLRDEDCTVVPYSGPFHFARMNNLAARAARGEILGFVNDDVVPLDSGWLGALVAHVQRPEVGAAGAKLLYPSGTIQHAGIVTGFPEGTGHVGRGLVQSDLWRWLDLTRNVSAVTGACLAIRREVFETNGGFDCDFPVNYNDVDLCLRLRQQGLLVVCEPRALLRHDECQTRLPGIRYSERTLFFDRWGKVLSEPDPYYSPSLSGECEETSFRTLSA